MFFACAFCIARDARAEYGGWRSEALSRARAGSVVFDSRTGARHVSVVVEAKGDEVLVRRHPSNQFAIMPLRSFYDDASVETRLPVRTQVEGIWEAVRNRDARKIDFVFRQALFNVPANFADGIFLVLYDYSFYVAARGNLDAPGGVNEVAGSDRYDLPQKKLVDVEATTKLLGTFDQIGQAIEAKVAFSLDRAWAAARIQDEPSASARAPAGGFCPGFAG